MNRNELCELLSTMDQETLLREFMARESTDGLEEIARLYNLIEEEEEAGHNQCLLCGGWFPESELEANAGYCFGSCREIDQREEN